MSAPTFIQFIGTQRSGSNLLRLMLNQLPEVAAPHPPHVLKVMMPMLYAYGDLTVQGNLERLANDISELVARNPVDWLGGAPTAQEIVELRANGTVYGLLVGLYRAHAQHHNAQIACCKSMANHAWFAGLEATGVEPRYIHLVRDGRDVAASFRETVVGPKHPYCIGEQWAQDQAASMKIVEQLGPERAMRLSYEELIGKPVETLSRLCSWLGVPFRESMLHYYESEASQRAALAGKMWQNLSKPILTDNTQTFRKRLSLQDIALFEAAAGSELKQFGYARTVQTADLPTIDADSIKQFNRDNLDLQSAALEAASEADLEHRRAYNNWIQHLNEQAVSDSIS